VEERTMIPKKNKEYVRIFWDMDDTLFDTTEAAYKHHGFSNFYKTNKEIRGKRSVHEHADFSFEDFWYSLPVEFWTNIPKYEWADELIKRSCDVYGPKNVFFLTSHIPNESCPAGKQACINKHWPKLRDQIVMSHNKSSLVDNKSILVDDSFHHEFDFDINYKQKNFCLFPSMQNELHDIAELFLENPKLPMKYIRRLGIL
jgi:hypothetical protein